MLFIFLYISSFLLVIGCNMWFFLWLGFEINMISFLVIIYDKSLLKVECCMKYFIVQSLGSALMLMCLYLDFKMKTNLLLIIMAYSMGGGPFFFWFPSICSCLDWFSLYMLMTFQKFMPCLLMSCFSSSVNWFLIIVSLLMGILGSFNESDLKSLMAYSSVHHIGWMILCMNFNNVNWFLYLVFYSFMISGLIFYFFYYNIVSIVSLSFYKFYSFVFILMMMNMGGMPPMFGFFLKWWVFSIIVNYDYFYLLILLVSSIIMFYIYMRVVFVIMVNSFNYYSLDLKFMDNYNMFFISEVFFILGGVFFPFVMMVFM